MFSLNESHLYYLCSSSVDMRKGFNSLCGVMRGFMQLHNSENAEETAIGAEESIPVTEGEGTDNPETFDKPDTADIPIYPGLPEHATIGEIPKEDEQAFDKIYEETAAYRANAL